jgi:recombination protein RecA
MVGESSSRTTRRAIPTGHASLDDALGTGGWPRGALAMLDAPRGSGATSLAIGSLAAAQADGGIVAWIDAAGSFDPATAARLGVRLEWLLVVQPAAPAEALEIAGWLARSRLVDAITLDLQEQSATATTLDRLASLLVRSGSVALLLAGEQLRATAGKAVSVRVALEREAWLAVGNDLVGQRVAATVTRHRWALSGGRASLDLWFGEGRRIDPLLPSLAVPRPEAPAVEPGDREERPALRILSA